MIAALNRFAIVGGKVIHNAAMTNDAERLMGSALDAVRARRDEMHALTRMWVEVNSYTANVAGVNAVGDMLKESFGQIRSLSVTQIMGGPEFGDHLVWRT